MSLQGVKNCNPRAMRQIDTYNDNFVFFKLEIKKDSEKLNPKPFRDVFKKTEFNIEILFENFFGKQNLRDLKTKLFYERV